MHNNMLIRCHRENKCVAVGSLLPDCIVVDEKECKGISPPIHGGHGLGIAFDIETVENQDIPIFNCKCIGDVYLSTFKLKSSQER